MLPDDLRTRWETIAEPTRVAIVSALAALVHAELDRLDTFYPASAFDKLTVEVLGVDDNRVHFIAHHLNYNFAQSGSDWADHYVLVGSAAFDGASIFDSKLKMAVHESLTERGYDNYDRRPVEQKVRAETLAQLCAPAPLPFE